MLRFLFYGIKCDSPKFADTHTHMHGHGGGYALQASPLSCTTFYCKDWFHGLVLGFPMRWSTNQRIWKLLIRSVPCALHPCMLSESCPMCIASLLLWVPCRLKVPQVFGRFALCLGPMAILYHEIHLFQAVTAFGWLLRSSTFSHFLKEHCVVFPQDFPGRCHCGASR